VQEEEPASEAIEEWSTGHFDREGADRYVHLIRSPSDPRDVSARGGKVGRTTANAQLGQQTKESWRAAIEQLLETSAPVTFNALCLLLCARTADIMFETPLDDALWSLVDDARIEHTWDAPILFRAIKKAASPEGKAA
jgi:hypothetical protein